LADYETIQRRRNIVVGIFVLVSLVALGWLIFKFGDLPIQYSKWKSYQIYVQFASAPGVDKGTPVRLGGYQIGRVIDVMAPEMRKDLKTGLEYFQTVVILAIDKKYITIPSNSDIKLMKRGLGSSYIEIQIDPTRQLKPLDPNRPETVYLQHNVAVQGSVGMVSEFVSDETQKKLEELLSNINALIGNINDVVGDRQNRENIRTTLANLTELSARARQTLKEFEQFSATSRAAVNNVNDRLSEVADVVLESGEEFNAVLRESRAALEKLNAGQGTAARLLTDGRLYENLLDSTEEMRLALEEFKQVMEKTNKKGGIKLSIF